VYRIKANIQIAIISSYYLRRVNITKTSHNINTTLITQLMRRSW